MALRSDFYFSLADADADDCYFYVFQTFLQRLPNRTLKIAGDFTDFFFIASIFFQGRD